MWLTNYWADTRVIICVMGLSYENLCFLGSNTWNDALTEYSRNLAQRIVQRDDVSAYGGGNSVKWISYLNRYTIMETATWLRSIRGTFWCTILVTAWYKSKPDCSFEYWRIFLLFDWYIREYGEFRDGATKNMELPKIRENLDDDFMFLDNYNYYTVDKYIN